MKYHKPLKKKMAQPLLTQALLVQIKKETNAINKIWEQILNNSTVYCGKL